MRAYIAYCEKCLVQKKQNTKTNESDSEERQANANF